MISDFPFFFGYILAATFGIISAVLYFRIQTLKLFLTDAAKRFEAGKRAYFDLDKNAKELVDQNSFLLSRAQKLDATLEENRARYAKKARELEVQLEEQKRQKLVNERATSHLDEQTKSLTDQLRASENERIKLRDTLNREFQQKNEPILKESAVLRSDLKTAQDQNTNLQKENARLRKMLEKQETALQEVNIDMVKKIRKRAQNLEQLYMSMKGLRELAEERNQNWEVALRALSAYVLSENNDKVGNYSSLGEAVAMSLEKIGVTMIVDEFAASAVAPSVEKPIKAAAPKKTKKVGATAPAKTRNDEF
jgi:chromosome segregation ATPase